VAAGPPAQLARFQPIPMYAVRMCSRLSRMSEAHLGLRGEFVRIEAE